MALDDFGGCALEFLSLGTDKGRWGGQKENFKTKSGSTVESHDMRISGILDRETPVEELVCLQIRPRQLTMGIVLFRKETPGTKYHAVQPVFEEMEAAKPLGSELGHPVDVPRCEGSEVPLHPDSSGTCLLTNGL